MNFIFLLTAIWFTTFIGFFFNNQLLFINLLNFIEIFAVKFHSIYWKPICQNGEAKNLVLRRWTNKKIPAGTTPRLRWDFQSINLLYELRIFLNPKSYDFRIHYTPKFARFSSFIELLFWRNWLYTAWGQKWGNLCALKLIMRYRVPLSFVKRVAFD